MANQQAQVRQFIIWGGAAFVFAMAYGSGMRARTKEIGELNERRKVFQQEARLAQMTNQADEARLHQLEARRLLDVAADALDRGDADGAKTAVAEALTRLKTAASANAATTGDFTGLISDLSALSLDDAPAAKIALSGFAHAMDETFARIGGLPAPNSLSKVTVIPPTDNDKPVLGNDLTRVK